jgi:hypothetical protein
MVEYAIELYGRGSSEPYVLFVDTTTIEKAAVKAATELKEANFFIGDKEIWDAKIINPEGEDYVILKNSILRINPKTGKQLDSLEEKLD